MPPPPRRKLGDDALASWQVQRKLANGQLLTVDEMELLRAQAAAETEAAEVGAEASTVAPLATLPARGTVEAARLSALRVKAERGLLLSAAELDMLRELSAAAGGSTSTSGIGGGGGGGGGNVEEHDASVAEEEGALRGGHEMSLLLEKLEAEHLLSAEEWAVLRANEDAATANEGTSWRGGDNGGGEVDAVPEEFAEQLWLTPRTKLTVTTPVSVLNSFCRDHGFYLRQLGTNMTPHEQRCKLRELLLMRGWPQGRGALMRAIAAPMSPRPALPINGAAMPF